MAIRYLYCPLFVVADFKGFPQEGIAFLKDLKVHNTKGWFEDNRHLWQKHIHEPNIHFIQEMGETLQILVPTIHAKAKVSGSLFKIYRDIRFSKDKTPMKSKIGLLFWQGQSHRMQSSSFYMHYDKDSYFIAAGVRAFKPELLSIYRAYIQNPTHAASLHQILDTLKQKGYLFPEPKYKRVPKGFDKEMSHLYLCFYGAMYAYKEFPIDNTFYSDQICQRVFGLYEEMADLQRWVYKMTLTD